MTHFSRCSVLVNGAFDNRNNLIETLKRLDTAGKWVSAVTLLADVASLIINSASESYKLEEAVYNQFSTDIWLSSERWIVQGKFTYVMDEVNRMIEDGDIGLIERSGRWYFRPLTFSGEKALSPNGIEKVVGSYY